MKMSSSRGVAVLGALLAAAACAAPDNERAANRQEEKKETSAVMQPEADDTATEIYFVAILWNPGAGGLPFEMRVLRAGSDGTLQVSVETSEDTIVRLAERRLESGEFDGALASLERLETPTLPDPSEMVDAVPKATVEFWWRSPGGQTRQAILGLEELPAPWKEWFGTEEAATAVTGQEQRWIRALPLAPEQATWLEADEVAALNGGVGIVPELTAAVAQPGLLVPVPPGCDPLDALPEKSREETVGRVSRAGTIYQVRLLEARRWAASDRNSQGG
ncbi:MAG: hypothetical protein KF858_08120 [Candidatus Sumerlaeia bacterium]|nr:hypothetical protein [Candidatus Sumerlaeia bacterium]